MHLKYILRRLKSVTVCCVGGFMRLPYEKHVKYINVIEVKHNSLIKQQQQ